jgi:hypothetical protein
MKQSDRERQQFTGWVERSDSHPADNCRVELKEAAVGGLFSLNQHHAAWGFTTANPRSDRACILVA